MINPKTVGQICLMTSIHQNYYNYLETKRHNEEMERQGREQIDVSKQEAETHRIDASTRQAAQKTNEQYTAAQIHKIANDIRQKDVELNLKADMNSWQKSVDKFNQQLKTQEQSLNQSKLDFEKSKWGDSQSNWLKEYNLSRDKYNLAKREYDLALDQFKHHKTMDYWDRVLATAKTLTGIVNDLTKARSISLKDAAQLAALAAK